MLARADTTGLGSAQGFMPCLRVASPALHIMSEAEGWLHWKICGFGQI